MLVVTANWAIPDGSLSAPPPRRHFRQFITDTCRAAVRAGFRSDGRYCPIDRVVLVLAGDTFDGLVSERWLGEARPWERRREAAARHAEVFHAAWRHARRPLAAVARLARRGIAVPSAGRHGRPVPSACVNVPVHAVMLAGDRDAALEGLARGGPSERLGIGVGNAWDDGAVLVVHGDAADPLAAGDTGPAILESLAVDLLARFAAVLVARPAFGDGGRRLVRALSGCHALEMPRHLRTGLLTTTHDSADTAWVIDAWRRTVDRWEREARRHDCAADHGVVDAIAWWMHALEPDTRPSPAARQVIAALATSLSLRGGGHAVTVAGHPGEVAGRIDPRVVCLGPPALQSVTEAGFGPGGPGAVSCVEAGPTVGPTSPPAVALFEAGEGGGRRLEWLSAHDVGGVAPARPGAVPILEAA